MDINILFFDGFETLDVFGPLEIFGKTEEFNIRHISFDGGVITSAQGTKIYTDCLKDFDSISVLLIPGGMGTRILVNDKDFIANLKESAGKSKYCLSVCTGAALLAKTDLLNGKNATTNKKSYDWVVEQNQNVSWVKEVRWTVDDKFYTSSGVSAGIDMALGFVSDLFGYERAKAIARHIEYIWREDRYDDPFAK